MIQLALDASMLRKTAAAGEAAISITVAGCSLADTAPGAGDGWDAGRVIQELCPWNWQSGPDRLLIVWLDASGNWMDAAGKPNISDVPLSNMADVPGHPYFEAIKANVEEHRKYYEATIREELEKGGDLFPKIALHDFGAALPHTPEGQVAHGTEIAVSDEGQTAGLPDNPSVNYTGFLAGSIAQFAQRNPPVNWLLNLAHFGLAPITPPEDATAFVAFPYSQTDVNSPWHNSDPAAVAVVDAAQDPADRLYRLVYTPAGAATMNAYCLSTPLSAPDKGNGTITLRDDQGNFIGRVRPQLSDVPDWVPALLLAARGYFHPCALMLAYVEAQGSLDCPALADLAAFKSQLNSLADFLYATLRDVAGFGLQPTGDLLTLPEQLTRFWCDQHLGRLESLTSEAAVKAYWKEYDTIQDNLLELCKTEDARYDLAVWKALLKELPGDPENKVPEKPVIRGYAALLGQLPLPPLPPDPASEDELGLWCDRVNALLQPWLAAWGTALAPDNDGGLPAALSRAQFLELNWPAVMEKFYDLALFRDVPAGEEPYTFLTEAWKQMGDTEAVHKGAVLWSHRTEALQGLNETDFSGKRLAEDCGRVLKSHLNERVAGNGQYPVIPPPAAGLAGIGLPAPLSWSGFLAFSQGRVTDPRQPASAALPGGLEPVIATLSEKTSPTALPLKIKADDLAPDSSDDLSDELAGHLLLLVRSRQLNKEDFAGSEWKHLNSARLTTYIDDQIQATDYIINPVLVPPPMEGQPPLLLEVSNEKRSLVAATGSDPDHVAGKPDPNQKRSKHYQHYEEDKEHKVPTADELWYGYHYRVAAFVALNSGALPPLIAHSAAFPNVPLIELKPYSAIPEAQTALHHYLRRVPVSHVRATPRRPEAQAKTEPIYKPLPEGLQPLACELKEWKGNLDKPAGPATDDPLKPSQTLYLLAEDIKESARGGRQKFFQEELAFALQRPVTPYENWRAWMGKPDNDDLSRRAADQEKENRTGRSPGGKPVRPFCDPADAGALLLKAQLLFPDELVEKTVLIRFTDAELEDLLADPEKVFAVQYKNAGAEAFSLTEAVLTVPRGAVVRLCIYALIPEAHFAGDNRRFHSWMTKTTAGVYTPPVEPGQPKIDYRLTQPTELWFEAAIAPDDVRITGHERGVRGARNRFAGQLWKALKIQEEANGVTALLERTDRDTSRSLAYMSRAEVAHQVWSWNGRLEHSADYFPAPYAYLVAANPGIRPEDRERALEELRKTEAFSRLSLDDLPAKKGMEALHRAVWNTTLDPEPSGDVAAPTTRAMEWEAGAFSDRPDYSAPVAGTVLLAFRSRDVATGSIAKPLSLFTDQRTDQETALYYRFAIRVFSRYERLGPAYAGATQGTVRVGENVGSGQRVADNPWRRFIRYSRREHVLPRPSIRFIIPLTRTIEECRGNEDRVDAAPLLMVLDDHWFSEAGLAEQLEIGIDLVPDPANEHWYLNAGPDPIISGNALNPVSDHAQQAPYFIEQGSGGHWVLVCRPAGPVGLTYDFAAQTPRLRGSAFIITLPNLAGIVAAPGIAAPLPTVNELGAWDMMQIAARRALRPQFCRPGVAVAARRSEWTAREWVQAVPSTEDIIPAGWRARVKRYTYLSLVVPAAGSLKPEGAEMPLPAVPDGDLIIRCYILTRLVSDIGGQPAEQYLGTYLADPANGSARFVPDYEGMPAPKLSVWDKGFVRIMHARFRQGYDAVAAESSVWKGLFGTLAAGDPADFEAVQDDSSLAMPLISERIPYRIV